MKYSEEETEEILEKILTNKNTSDELKKQIAKLLAVLKLSNKWSFSTGGNVFVIVLIFSAMLTLALSYERYEIAYVALIAFAIIYFVPLALIQYRGMKIKALLQTKQASSSSD